MSKQVDDLQFENAQLSELYDEMQKSVQSAEVLPENKSETHEEHAAHESGGLSLSISFLHVMYYTESLQIRLAALSSFLTVSSLLKRKKSYDVF